MAISDCGRRIVAAIGTRVRLANMPGVRYPRVDITALKRNTDDVYIGNHLVGAAANTEVGHVLGPGDTLTLTDQNLFDVWIDANVNDEGVMWMAYSDAADG